jgi:hypothetical protein
MRRAPASGASQAEAIKQLLGALEAHSDSIHSALEQGAGDISAELEERQRMFEQLDLRVHALVSTEQNVDTRRRLLSELARPVADIVEAQERLVAKARKERDRIGAAIERLDRPDLVARQYEVRGRAAPTRRVSVKG